MKKYIKADEWCIVEEGFNPENHEASESIFSLGNGKMGHRANFEEKYTGKSLQGSYVAGIYYPDKTRVGWWKNGYPEYFAKVLNSPNWIGINVEVEGEDLDLFTANVEDFTRVLNMQEGTLNRKFTATLSGGNRIKVETQRFTSMADTENGVIRYSVTPQNFDGTISLTPYLDGDVMNQDANYDEKFWNIKELRADKGEAYLISQTKKLDFHCAFGMKHEVLLDGQQLKVPSRMISSETMVGNQVEVNIKKGQTLTLIKYVGVLSSLNHPVNELLFKTQEATRQAVSKGYAQLFKAHKAAWAEKWEHSDIKITGDIEAQQGIRFNIFHMHQTYTGEDARLNVGPKGFTGEKYGGSTYWDTEAYCIPFFISTAPAEVTRNLLVYRHKHLSKAIENAEKLGFTGGAALYPMVTMNGEECHNEWEITFEEIHRNGAIAYAIHNYIRHTGDEQYLADYGLEVLIGIARFWGQRATWSDAKQKYVILGVTGPNEYENNINNNWYTNKLAVWCLQYTLEALERVKTLDQQRYEQILASTNFSLREETTKWQEVAEKMHFAYDEERQIFLQQDGFLDKEQILAKDLDPAIRPINQHWSWDRILRSCYIKQADTLQGIYLLEEQFDTATIKRHFEFYEPRTVHESSLSPCVHAILAARIKDNEKAYEMYLRTSRLDLDDYNSEVHEGLHITSMAGTWMAIVEGFGGKRVYDKKLYLNPIIPKEWKEYAFRLTFLGNDLEIRVSQEEVEIISHAPRVVIIFIYGDEIILEANKSKTVTLKK